jgi:hypothetical protein
MATTGYSDTFNRTVASGLGSATSGQAYTLFGVASQFSVAPSTASIAISSAGDKMGYIDLQTQSLDITGQVALGAIPATNLATVGFVSKLSTTANYYNATMMVATGGAISLRFSKVVSGGLVTIATVATGLTYVANTFYNLRYQIYWSNALQTNVMSSMLWVVGSTPPTGWMATAQDNALTNFTSGTQVGIMSRDESTVLGTITSKHQAVVARSYNLPMPATTDPMCYDPAFPYPMQTALESLADATDAVMATIDPLTSLAGLFPRVRVSGSMTQVNQTAFAASFSATEFNVGTPTNLAYNPLSIYLPVGIWLVTFEVRLTSPSANSLSLQIFGITNGLTTYMRPWPTQTNDLGVNGTGHVSTLTYSTDPTTPAQVSVEIFPTNTATTETISYMALSAIKISDYFA